MKLKIHEFDYDNCELLLICPTCGIESGIYHDCASYEKHPLFRCCKNNFILDYTIEEFEFILQNNKPFINIQMLDLLMIKRIATEYDIEKFINLYNEKNGTTFKYTFDIQKHMNIDMDQFIKVVLDKVGFELNSYNIVDVLNKYPDAEIEHSYEMFIEVIEKNGQLTPIYYLNE